MKGHIKNVVLVHGAFADGSGWEAVANILKNDGYKVLRWRSSPETSYAEDQKYTKAAIDAMGGPVVLVGHSYGGSIITEAGNHPNVAALVYIAAFALDEGESCASIEQALPQYSKALKPDSNVTVEALNRPLQGRLAALPGVIQRRVSPILRYSPAASAAQRSEFPIRPGVAADSNWLQVGTGYFDTLRAHLLTGRDFTPADFVATAASMPAVPGAPPPANGPPKPVIVNKAFVKQYFAGLSPLGRHFNYKHTPGEPEGSGFVVIGVVSDIKYNSLREAVAPTTYAPAVGRGVTFALRTAASPTALTAAVRDAVRETDSNLPIIDISTQAATIDRLLAQERIIAQLASFIGFLALLLACTGLFGLLSHEVGTRTREIGIRMALGARRGDVRIRGFCRVYKKENHPPKLQALRESLSSGQGSRISFPSSCSPACRFGPSFLGCKSRPGCQAPRAEWCSGVM